MSILNATALGGGQYLATLTTADQKTFDLQLVYNTQIASASNVPDVFKLSFATSITTVDGTSTLTETRYVAIKDAANANDLVYVDPATGNNVLILPGQGIPHIVHAGNGGVTIYGSNANDALYGGSGNDTIIGGAGSSSYFEGGAGADVLTGNATGNNTAGYTGSAAGVTINLAAGTASGGDAQGDTLTNIQNLIGSAHDDTFVANAAANRLDGGSGGSDTVSYVASGSAVTVNMVTMSGSGGYAQGNTYANIRNIIGSNYDDLFIGGPQANHFDGGQGGFDTVSYALSDQAVTVDLYNGTASGGYAAGDTLAHIWNVIGSAYNDTFIASNDHNQFDGGLGVNTVSYQYSGGGVVIDLSNAIGTGTGGNFADGDRFVNIQNLLGSLYDDTFVASSDANVLDGNTGSLHNRVSYAASNQGVTST